MKKKHFGVPRTHASIIILASTICMCHRQHCAREHSSRHLNLVEAWKVYQRGVPLAVEATSNCIGDKVKWDGGLRSAGEAR